MRALVVRQSPRVVGRRPHRFRLVGPQARRLERFGFNTLGLVEERGRRLVGDPGRWYDRWTGPRFFHDRLAVLGGPLAVLDELEPGGRLLGRRRRLRRLVVATRLLFEQRRSDVRRRGLWLGLGLWLCRRPRRRGWRRRGGR